MMQLSLGIREGLLKEVMLRLGEEGEGTGPVQMGTPGRRTNTCKGLESRMQVWNGGAWCGEVLPGLGRAGSLSHLLASGA
jgi:hypothetical protein